MKPGPRTLGFNFLRPDRVSGMTVETGNMGLKATIDRNWRFKGMMKAGGVGMGQNKGKVLGACGVNKGEIWGENRKFGSASV